MQEAQQARNLAGRLGVSALPHLVKYISLTNSLQREKEQQRRLVNEKDRELTELQRKARTSAPAEVGALIEAREVSGSEHSIVI
jgi:hypothetical protein